MARKADYTQEIKPRYYRIDDQTQEKIEHLSNEVFGSKNECLKALIQLYELQESKKILPGFTDDIDNFKGHLSAIQDAFIHVLQMNADAEMRIQEKYDLQLSTDAKTIATLQESLEKSKADLTSFRELYREEKRIAERRLDELGRLQISLQDKERLIKMLEEQVSQLSSDLNSANEELAANTERLSHIDSLEAEVEQQKSIIFKMEQQLSGYEIQLANEKEAAAKAAERAKDEAEAKLKTALQDASFSKEKELLTLKTQYQDEINALKQKQYEQIQSLLEKYGAFADKNPASK